jgi:hypothetical protein
MTRRMSPSTAFWCWRAVCMPLQSPNPTIKPLLSENFSPPRSTIHTQTLIIATRQKLLNTTRIPGSDDPSNVAEYRFLVLASCMHAGTRVISCPPFHTPLA